VQWCRDGDFLCPVFAASRVQRISDLHSKFALRPHHVPNTLQDAENNFISFQTTAEIRQGNKKRRKKEERKKHDENIMVCPIT